MKKIIFFALFVCAFALEGKSQITYQDNYLTFNRGRYANYMTSWAGWAHYFGPTDTNGIKIQLNAADPRMSTTTNKLVFLDSDRVMYIDIYCRTLYTSSDENSKVNIKSLRSPAYLRATNMRSSSPMTNLVMKLNPVSFHWKDEAEYEKFNIRPVHSGVEEMGFLAQELEKVLPGAVAMTAEGDRLVNYSALIPVLTAAIQELNERVAALEAQLDAK